MTAKKKPEDLLPVGAPTKYEERFCDIYIEHCKAGGLVEDFPAYLHEQTGVKVCQDTIYEWAKCGKFPEFSESKKLGDAYSRRYWLNSLRDASQGGVKGYPGGPIIFLMKNKFGWRDQLDVSTDPIKDQEKRDRLDKILDDPDMAKQAALIARKLKNE